MDVSPRKFPRCCADPFSLLWRRHRHLAQPFPPCPTQSFFTNQPTIHTQIRFFRTLPLSNAFTPSLSFLPSKCPDPVCSALSEVCLVQFNSFLLQFKSYLSPFALCDCADNHSDKGCLNDFRTYIPHESIYHLE